MSWANLATTESGVPTFRRGGFTLVEVLLVLAIFLLFSALFIPGVNSILREMDERGPEQIVSETILAARNAALESGHTVALYFDSKERRFQSDGEVLEFAPLPSDMKVELLPPETGATVLLGGQLVETEELRRVRFFPDGTCDPFRMRIQEAGQNAWVLVADPWTCALSPVVAKR